MKLAVLMVPMKILGVAEQALLCINSAHGERSETERQTCVGGRVQTGTLRISKSRFRVLISTTLAFAVVVWSESEV